MENSKALAVEILSKHIGGWSTNNSKRETVEFLENILKAMEQYASQSREVELFFEHKKMHKRLMELTGLGMNATIDDLVSALDEANVPAAPCDHLREALEKIQTMKLEPGETDYKYAFNRCWHIATEALAAAPSQPDGRYMTRQEVEQVWDAGKDSENSFLNSKGAAPNKQAYLDKLFPQ